MRQFLAGSRRTFELLREGVRCDRIQFPALEEEGGSVAEHAQSLSVLGELAQTWSLLARSHIVQGDLAAASAQLQMGHTLCRGEVLVMHYLIGSGIMRMALNDIRLLIGPKLSRSIVSELSDVIGRWKAEWAGAPQCVRVDLCCHSLREPSRLSKNSAPQALVDESLERHYPCDELLADEDDKAEEDDRLAWRRDRILKLLEGHPNPFDGAATAELMGRIVTDRILNLKHRRWSNLSGQWHRLARAYHRLQEDRLVKLWPNQLRGSFPYEYLGPSAQKRLAELQPHVSARRRAEMQWPGDANLPAIRKRLRGTKNALGLLVADAMVSTNIFGHERLRRRQLRKVGASIRGCTVAG